MINGHTIIGYVHFYLAFISVAKSVLIAEHKNLAFIAFQKLHFSLLKYFKNEIEVLK
jgi:hypothetical protein